MLATAPDSAPWAASRHFHSVEHLCIVLERRLRACRPSSRLLSSPPLRSCLTPDMATSPPPEVKRGQYSTAPGALMTAFVNTGIHNQRMRSLDAPPSVSRPSLFGTWRGLSIHLGRLWKLASFSSMFEDFPLNPPGGHFQLHGSRRRTYSARHPKPLIAQDLLPPVRTRLLHDRSTKQEPFPSSHV